MGERVNEYSPTSRATGKRVALAVSQFNEPITRRLLDGAVSCLEAAGVDPEAIDVFWVAGAFELPQTAARLVATGNYHGVSCLGALIRGETIHFDVLSYTVAAGIDQVARSGHTPVTFGVVTAENMDQAEARSGGVHGNHGWNAAHALVGLMGQEFGSHHG